MDPINWNAEDERIEFAGGKGVLFWRRGKLIWDKQTIHLEPTEAAFFAIVIKYTHADQGAKLSSIRKHWPLPIKRSIDEELTSNYVSQLAYALRKKIGQYGLDIPRATQEGYVLVLPSTAQEISAGSIDDVAFEQQLLQRLFTKLTLDYELSWLTSNSTSLRRGLSDVGTRTIAIIGESSWRHQTQDILSDIWSVSLMGQYGDPKLIEYLRDTPIRIGCATNSVAAIAILLGMRKKYRLQLHIDYSQIVGRDQMRRLQYDRPDVMINGNAAFILNDVPERENYMRRFALHKERNMLVTMNSTCDQPLQRLTFAQESAAFESIALYQKQISNLPRVSSNTEPFPVLPVDLFTGEIDVDPTVGYLAWEPLAIGLQQRCPALQGMQYVGDHYVCWYSHRDFIERDKQKAEVALVNLFCAEWNQYGENPRSLLPFLSHERNYLAAFARAAGQSLSSLKHGRLAQE